MADLEQVRRLVLVREHRAQVHGGERRLRLRDRPAERGLDLRGGQLLRTGGADRGVQLQFGVHPAELLVRVEEVERRHVGAKAGDVPRPAAVDVLGHDHVELRPGRGVLPVAVRGQRRVVRLEGLDRRLGDGPGDAVQPARVVPEHREASLDAPDGVQRRERRRGLGQVVPPHHVLPDHEPPGLVHDRVGFGAVRGQAAVRIKEDSHPVSIAAHPRRGEEDPGLPLRVGLDEHRIGPRRRRGSGRGHPREPRRRQRAENVVQHRHPALAAARLVRVVALRIRRREAVVHRVGEELPRPGGDRRTGRHSPAGRRWR